VNSVRIGATGVALYWRGKVNFTETINHLIDALERLEGYTAAQPGERWIGQPLAIHDASPCMAHSYAIGDLEGEVLVQAVDITSLNDVILGTITFRFMERHDLPHRPTVTHLVEGEGVVHVVVSVFTQYATKVSRVKCAAKVLCPGTCRRTPTAAIEVLLNPQVARVITRMDQASDLDLLTVLRRQAEVEAESEYQRSPQLTGLLVDRVDSTFT
jgi:hypothetical protein